MKKHIPSKSVARRSLSTLLAYAAFQGLSFGATFVGETIGVNFQGRGAAGGGGLLLNDTAGVLGQQDWNNIDYGGNGGTNNNQLITTNNLMYDDVTANTSGTSSVSISVQAADSWNSGSGNSTPNHTLMDGIIKANGGNANPTFSFSGLSAGSFRVIVYTMENGGGGRYSMSLGGTTYYQDTQNGPAFGGTFVQGTNTTAGPTPPVANYVDFNGVVSTTGTLSLGFSWLGGSDGVGISGIQLQMLSAITAWSGTVNGNWDTTTLNWSGVAFTNGNPGLFLDLDTNNVAPVTRTITVDAGGVTVSSMVVTNSTGDYTFSGGVIGGTGGLIKSGSSALTFNSTTTYTGGTTVNGGTMNLGHATDTLANAEAVTVGGGTLAIGANSDTVGAVTLTSGSITGSTGVLTGSSYDLRSGSVSAILGGAGALTKTTSGTVVLTGANTYTGATNINGGVLQANDGVGLPSGLVTINGGVLATGANFVRAVGVAAGEVQVTGGASGFAANGAPVIVSLGGLGTPTALTWGDPTFNPSTLLLNPSTADNTLEFRNALNLNGVNRTVNVGATGGGTAATLSGVLSSVGGSLTKTGNGTLVLSAANTYDSGTTVSGGTLRLGAANSLLSGSALSIGTGASVDLNSFSPTIGVLTSTGTVTNSAAATTGTLTVASGTVNSPGTIVNGAGTVALLKNTGGTLTVNAANTYSGGTNVTGGTLSLLNNAAAGTGGVTLQAGTILEFGGTQTAGLYEGLLTGAFNTASANTNEFIRNTTRMANLSGNNAAWPGSIPDDRTVIYTGFINNTGAATNWTFGENYDDNVLLKVNGSTVLNDTTWNNPTHGTVAINPGFNSFELRLGQGGGGWGRNNASWWQNNLGIGVDYTGAGAPVGANYVALPVDDGIGVAEWITGAASAADNIANAVTLNGNATIRIGYSFAAASGSARMGSLAMGGNTVQLSGTPTASSISSGATTVSTGANFNVDSNVTFNPGALNDGAAAAAVTKSGTGLMRVNTTATSVIAGSSINVAAGTLAFSGTSPFGTGSVTLNGGTILQLEGQTAPGLLTQLYNVDPNGNNGNYNNLGTLNTYLNGLTASVTTNSTTGGKLNFDYSNDGYGGGAPFNVNDHPTRAAYGFAPTDNIQVRWTGLINVTNAGLATFRSRSDDGSMIFIDGAVVVNNNNFQGATTVTGTTTLTAGLHEITLAFFEGGGGAGALFEWNQAGDSLHPLLNTEVLTVGAVQTYANNVSVAGNSTIAVSTSLRANIGILSIGTSTLSVTSPSPTAGAYSLNASSTTLTGNPTFNVANSTGGGVGTVNPGPLSDGGVVRTITKTNSGILRVESAGSSLIAGTTFDVQQGSLAVASPLLNPLSNSTVQLSGGKLSLEGGPGQQAGLFTQLYNVDPNGNNGNYNSLGTLTTYLDGLTPLVSTASTTGGKLTFDYSNSGYGNGAPFNGPNDGSHAAYGFAPDNNIQVRWTGMINVTNPGLATFQSRSDDGTMIFIDGAVVVNNNNFQGATTVTGTTTLTAGLHQITLAFFEGGGGAGALFEWNQAGDTLHTLLSSEVSHTGIGATQTYANNVSVTANSEIAISTSLAAEVGVLSIGGSTLTVSSPSTTSAAYSLTAASTTLTGNATFNVLNSTGGGAGVLVPNVITGGANSITKTGNGALVLDEANTYSGGTTVSAGTLFVSNVSGSATGSGTVTLQTTGRLSGTGTVAGDVSVQSGGIFAPGFGTGTTLNIGGNVTVVDGAALNYTLAGNGVNETALITGTMGLSGGVTLNLTELAGFGPGNSYILATASSVTSSATYTFNQSGPGSGLPGITLSVTVVGGNQLVLGVTNQSLTWTGGNNDQWDNATLGNWTPVNPFLDGYSVTFDDIGIAAQSVVAIGTIVKPWTTTFNNTVAGGDYVINGVIGGTGPDGVTKLNTGGAYLTGSNTYAGKTRVLGGILGITADNNLGAAPAAATAGHLVLNGGTLYVGADMTINANRGIAVGTGAGIVDVDPGFTVTYGGVIADLAPGGVLTKNGDGTLILAGTSTFSGGTVVNGGILRLNVGSQPGTLAGDGPITINSGGTVSSGAVDGTGYYNHTANNGITINEGGTLRTLENGRLSMDRTINSIGGTIASTGVNFDNNASYNFRATGNGPANSYNFTSTGGGTESTISATNVGVDNATFNVTLGGGAVDLRVTGNIKDQFGTGGLTKAGNGVMVLAGVNTQSSLTITGGTVNISGAGTLGSNTTALKITNGANLNLGGTTQTVGLVGAAGVGNGIVGNITNGGLNLNNQDMFFQNGTMSANLSGGVNGRLWIGGDAGATVLLGGNNTSTFNDTHSTIIGHATTGDAGTVRLTSATALGPVSQLTEVFTGTLDLNGQTAVTVGTIDLKSGPSSSLVNNSGTAASFNGTVAMNALTANVGGTGDMTLGGTVQNGGLNKTGAGTLTLTGAQNYTYLKTAGGTTNVNGSFTGGTAIVDANATTNFGSSQDLMELNIGTNPLAFAGGGGVVPEPGSAVLLMGGLLTMLGLRRRRA